ncbi:kelch repeat and BTB domain-containing protein 12 [Lampetra fluviatilis]
MAQSGLHREPLPEAPRHEASEGCGSKHSQFLLEQLSRLRDTRQLTDVDLLAGAASFPCHRAVLAAFSPYFRAMFTCGLAECERREVRLHDLAPDSLAVLLDYMYTARLRLCNANVQGVATGAFLLQMDSVFAACSRHMLDNMEASNCVGLHAFARQIGAEQLADAAHDFLRRHFAEVCLHDEILEVSADQLEALISSDELNVTREDPVLDVVLRWARWDRRARAPRLAGLLARVRLTLVSADCLSESLKRSTVLVSDAACSHMLAVALESVDSSRASLAVATPGAGLRYGMETSDVIVCAGTDARGVRSRRPGYSDACFCYAPSLRRTCYVVCPRQGEALAAVRAGVVTADNDIILAGEAGFTKAARRARGAPPAGVEFVRYRASSWEHVCSAPYRELYALAVARGHLYLLGGQVQEKQRYLVTNAAERLPLPSSGGGDGGGGGGMTQQWRSVSPLPVMLASHVALTVGSYIYVMGGWIPQLERPDEELERLSNRAFRYDSERDRWQELASMRFSRYRFGCAALNGEIYVVGGIGCKGPDRGQTRRCLDSLEIYSPDGDFWRDGPSLPSPLLSLRSNASNAVAVNGRVFVCGGFNSPDRHEVIQKDILEFDPWDGGCWTVVARDVLMHNDYDACLVARLNLRDLIPPPPDLVEA